MCGIVLKWWCYLVTVTLGCLLLSFFHSFVHFTPLISCLSSFLLVSRSVRGFFESEESLGLFKQTPEAAKCWAIEYHDGILVEDFLGYGVLYLLHCYGSEDMRDCSAR